jgi:two-component system, chemotaxis family, protein-glutamate methylesterase/glutaminase
MSDYKAIMIGGSAGSFQIVVKILAALPSTFELPIFMCLHRLKHVRSGFVEALSIKSNLPIVEPFDKEVIRPGVVYLAPANYHMYIEADKRFALSTEEPVNHSRPSIDLSFMTAAQCYKSKLVGIILSGANKDGARGLKYVKDNGGLTIVQDPSEAQVETMPVSSMALTKVDYKYNSDGIISFLKRL